MERKPIPVGYEDFKKIIDKGLYYADKTMIIKELLDSGGETTLITRPRRFGKTLNLSTIRRFFEDERTEDGEPVDNGYLFDGLAISGCGEKYLAHQGKYPVISLSLKSGKQSSYQLSYGELKKRIAEEFQRHKYLLNGFTLSDDAKETFRHIMTKSDDEQLYLDALRFLSECLYKYHNTGVIILIDEYDVPLENAYFEGFYDQMIGFICSLFESALKTNPALERGVITGCLRISRESIFTGLNNLQIHSIVSPHYSSSFGFTEDEIKAMLAYYDLKEKYQELKDWYDGYLFGGTEIYNPWSIVNYVDMARADASTFPRPYWINTSSNSIIKELVEEAGDETRRELETLIAGGTIEKPIHEDITYGDIHANADNLWNFLFFTGYLRAAGQRQADVAVYQRMMIPNKEVKTVYKESITTWFDRRIKETDRTPLIKALEEGDCEAAGDFITSQLQDTISYFDYAENYYHGFLTGLLTGIKGYQVLSNRESGTGRPDLIIKSTRIRNGMAMILELKSADLATAMEERCREGIRQIEERDYEAELKKEGYPEIKKYGVCFFRKECLVRR